MLRLTLPYARLQWNRTGDLFSQDGKEVILLTVWTQHCEGKSWTSLSFPIHMDRDELEIAPDMDRLHMMYISEHFSVCKTG